MNLKRTFILILAAITLSVSAQNKKVAVVTFNANKYIGAEGMAGGAALVASIAKLAKDSNFNLTPILNNFHKTFFAEYAKGFTFDLLPESQIIGNEQYKNYKTTDTATFYAPLLIPGYNYLVVSVLYKTDLNKMIELFGNGVDGFMFVELEFKLTPKMAIGGMGTAGIAAYASLKIWNKEAKKVVNIYEYASSKGSVPLVAGIPVMSVEKILPLCKDASDRLLEDLKEKLPKIAKKSAKNL